MCIGHYFGDHVFQSFWGAQASSFSSTVVSLFIFIDTFVAVQELILAYLLIVLSRTANLHVHTGLLRPSTVLIPYINKFI